LFNYLFAKHYGGTFFVRIEDTDKKRNKAEWIDAIWNDFAWFGLTPDIKYVQSEHVEKHKELLHALVQSGKAYISKEPSKDDPKNIAEVVRLKNPGSSVTFNDLIRGEVTFDTTELGDFVIARSIDDPLYHFAVVVDDHEADVTHIIRAEEHISNTPRQILIQEALGFPRPQYAHIPLILAPDRSKLSKRKHSASVEHYQAQGYVPGAILNYLALLGWNPGTDEEFFTIDELIKRFTLDQVQKSGAIFDEIKLKWFNREYMLRLDDNSFLEQARKFLSEETSTMLDEKSLWQGVLGVMRERVQTFGELSQMDEEGEFTYFHTPPTYDPEALVWKKNPDRNLAKHRLTEVFKLVSEIGKEQWTQEKVKETVFPYADREGRGEVLWPFRFALSGREKSPDPFVIAGIIGKDETEQRIKTAIGLL
jgi:glutamyl-tRNA synthetase